MMPDKITQARQRILNSLNFLGDHSKKKWTLEMLAGMVSEADVLLSALVFIHESLYFESKRDGIIGVRPNPRLLGRQPRQTAVTTRGLSGFVPN